MTMELADNQHQQTFQNSVVYSTLIYPTCILYHFQTFLALQQNTNDFSWHSHQPSCGVHLRIGQQSHRGYLQIPKEILKV